VILEDNPNRRPQTFGGVVYLAVVALALVGLAFTIAGAWRTGVSWLGAGLVLGAVCRLVLPERRAGMLRVRRKAEDVVMLMVAGGALLVLAVVIPNQPGG
jgi:predicted nucleic acid-binding Zn ribbon protein